MKLIEKQAVKIVQAEKAWASPPELKDKLVKTKIKELNQMSLKERVKEYEWALRAISAMTWNTLTLNMGR